MSLTVSPRNVSRRSVRFTCARAVFEGVADDVPIDLGALAVEPLIVSVSYRVAAGNVHATLGIQVPNIAPYTMVKLIGEISVSGLAGDLRFSRALENVARCPGTSFGGLSLGSREAILKMLGADVDVHFSVTFTESVLLCDNARAGPEPIYRALHHPDFVVRRLQLENARLGDTVMELANLIEQTLAAPAVAVAAPVVAVAAVAPATPRSARLLSAAVSPRAGASLELGGAPLSESPRRARMPLAAKTNAAADSSAALKAVISRGDPIELRAAQLELKTLLSSIELKLEEAQDCTICMNSPANVLLGCGHVCSCQRCSSPLLTCPLCRAPIAKRTVLSLADAGHRQAQYLKQVSGS